VLKTSASTAHRDRRRIRGSQVVIALQMALCVVLLVTAGLLVRTLQNLESVNLGMKTDGLLVFGISPLARVHSDSEANRFYQGLIARLRSVPGVQSVTVMSNRIGTGWSNNTGAAVDGKPALGENKFAPMRWNVAGPDYFHTMGTPVLLGRDFTDADAESAPRVAIINQTFADRYLSGRSPLGHVVNLNPGAQNEFTIVGVVGDSKYTGVREPPRPMAYFPYTQIAGNATLHFEVRTAGNPGTWLPTVRRAVNEYANGLPLLQPMTQQSQFEQTFSQERLFFRLSMFFGLLAALLVATGLYATLAYSVSRRTSEVGLRMALGAQRGQVLWMVLRGSFVVTLIGVAIGFPLAIAATKVVRSVLFGVTPGDPLTFVGALIGIGLVAFLASLIPAVRAASVDPLVALRYE
jgi:predicted permease